MAPLQGFRLRSPRCSLAPHAVRVVWLALGVWMCAELPVHATARADTADGNWTRLNLPPASHLPATTSIALVYDSLRDRLIAFGGSPRNSNSHRSNDTWTLDMTPGANWVQLTPSGSLPSERLGVSGIYDPVGDRLIIFGGASCGCGGETNDVWQLSLSGTPTWTQLSPAGFLPSPRQEAAAIYDPVGLRLVVFGGYISDGPALSPDFLNDVWTLSLSSTPTWTRLFPPSGPPPARDLPMYTYNPDHGSLILFGGYNGAFLNDAWELTLSGSPTWSPIVAPSPPSPRRDGVAGYDPVAHRFVFSGGLLASLASTDEVWQLDLSGSPTWSQIAPAGVSPTPRDGARGAFDPVRRRLMVVAGSSDLSRADTRALTLSGSPTWIPSFDDGAVPEIGPRSGNASVLRPETHEMYTFGGSASSQVRLNELWRLDVSSPGAHWKPVAPAGTPPTARDSHRAVWDPVRKRMLVVGGYDGHYLNDVWSFAPADSAWAPLATSGAPPSARGLFGLDYDPMRDQLILIGGHAFPGDAYMNDAWALPLSGPSALTWTPLAPAGMAPDPRWISAMQYDPVRDRMVFFGGVTAAGRNNEVWALNLGGSTSWSQLAPAGTPPTDRTDHAMIYDPTMDRMVVFGGLGSTGYLSEVWALSLSGTPTWTQLVPTGSAPNARSIMSAVFDPAGRQMIEMGGWNGGYLGDTWSLAWETLVDVPRAAPVGAQLALEGARPNPAVGHRVTVSFVLPDAAPARLDLIDITGRRVATRDVAGLGAGRHMVAFEPERALQPGVYLVQLTGAGGMRTAKVCVMR